MIKMNYKVVIVVTLVCSVIAGDELNDAIGRMAFVVSFAFSF